MRRLFILVAATLAVTVLAVPSAWAGLGTSPTGPHFVDISATVSEGTLYVSIKEAGLGRSSGSTLTTVTSTIAWSVTAMAHCTNGGGNSPSAANKNVFADGVFPVDGNGQATGTIGLTPTFQPPCVPPMTLSFTDLTVTDRTNDIIQTVPGTFS